MSRQNILHNQINNGFFVESIFLEKKIGVTVNFGQFGNFLVPYL